LSDTQNALNIAAEALLACSHQDQIAPVQLLTEFLEISFSTSSEFFHRVDIKEEVGGFLTQEVI